MAFLDSAIPDDTQPQADDTQHDDPLSVIDGVIDYWRKKNGINLDNSDQSSDKESTAYDEGGPVDETAIPDDQGGADQDPAVLALQKQAPQSEAPAIPDDVGADDTRSSLSQIGGNQQVPPNTELTGATTEGIPSANTSGTDLRGAIGSGVKRFATYLMGNSANPQEVKQVEASIDPRGQMDQGQRKEAAVVAATQKGGEEAGARMVQAYRRSYEALRQSAAAVLDGTQNRPGDMGQAVQLATQAFDNLLDGTDVSFKPTGNGVIATTTKDGKVLSQTPLSLSAFKQVLRGPQGSFDYMRETSPGVLFQQLAKSQEGAPVGPEAGKLTLGAHTDANNTAQSSKPAEQPDQPLEYKGRRDLEVVASRLFPMASQEDKRAAFIASQMASGNDAKAKLEAATERAKVTGEYGLRKVGAQQEGQNQRADNRLQHLGQRESRLAADSAAKLSMQAAQMGQKQKATDLNFLGKMMTQIPPMPMDKIEAFARDKGISLDELLAPPQAPQQAQPVPQSGQPTSPAQQTKVINGFVYNKVPGGWKKAGPAQ